MSNWKLKKNIHINHKALLLSALMLFISSCQDITQAQKSSGNVRSTSTAGDGNGLVYLYNPAE